MLATSYIHENAPRNLTRDYEGLNTMNLTTRPIMSETSIRTAPKRICKIEGCERTYKIVRGMCMKHYQQFRKAGGPLLKKPAAIEQFWDKVDKTEKCWMWTGSVSLSGYGIFNNDYKSHRAHRWIYEHMNGPIGDLSIDHLCRNMLCVNPEHLEAVTTKENTRRGLQGILRTPRTRCPQGHPYSKGNTIIMSSGRRVCRICNKRMCNRYSRRAEEERKRGAKAARRDVCINGHDYTKENTRLSKKGTRFCMMCYGARQKRKYDKYRLLRAERNKQLSP